MSRFTKKVRKDVAGDAEDDAVRAFDGGRAQGVRPSIHNGWPVVSTGLADWDLALGGDGLPLGSVVYLQEDDPTEYFKGFCDYTLAEGIAQGHILGVAIPDDNPVTVLSQLPSVRGLGEADVGDGAQPPGSSASSKDMRIAWRYGSASTVEQTWEGQKQRAASFCHRYDLSRPSALTPEQVTPGTLVLMGPDPSEANCLPLVCDTFESHLRAASSARHSPTAARIVVRSLHSPLWCRTHRRTSPDSPSLPHLDAILRLRSLAREHLAVILITAHDASLPAGISAALWQWSDVVVRLDSFGGRGTAHAGLGDYHGVLSVDKLCGMASGVLRPPRMERHLYSFKRGRRKYTVDPAHAAPDEEVVSFETGKAVAGLTVEDSSVPDF